MSAEIIDIDAARAARTSPIKPASTTKHGKVYAMQASPDAVTVFVGPTELWFSADEADAYGDSLKRFAKSARELSRSK